MAITLDGNNTSTVGLINSATAQATTSGTYKDFTGIPSGVKRITVMFNGVSTNGTSNTLFQLGAGSVTTSGYTGAGANSSPATANYTTGFGINNANASAIMQGSIVFALVTGNTWCANGVFSRSDAAVSFTTAGIIALSGTLDRVRITTVNGTDTFDAGSINILYE